MSNWVLLQSFTSEGEARVVESRIKAEGIDTQLQGSHARPAVGNVPTLLRLMVLDKDLERAKAILNDT